MVKNKVAAPFKQAEFDIEFGKGISTSGCLLDYGIEHNIVTKSGSFFSYGDERLGQGRGNAKAFLDEHQDVAKEIEGKVYAALGLGATVRPIEERDGAPLAAIPTDEEVQAAQPKAVGVILLPDALALAFAYLNRRERTAAEVRARLTRAGCGEVEIEDTIGELVTLGQLDDARFAQLFAQDRRELDGWGHERIARRLRELGVERELIDEALADEARGGAAAGHRTARAAVSPGAC